jgi:hypothetical protein
MYNVPDAGGVGVGVGVGAGVGVGLGLGLGVGAGVGSGDGGGVGVGVGLLGHGLVDAELLAGADRFPAASNAITVNTYVRPHVREKTAAKLNVVVLFLTLFR